jgi:hypothetical protein
MNPQAQGRLIPRPTAPIPGGPTELGHATGPQATKLKGHLKPLGQFPAACGPQTFWEASDSMCLSSVEINHQPIQAPIRVLQLPEEAEDAHFPWW